MGSTRYYLRYEIMQPCGWCHVATMECRTQEEAQQREAALRAAHPQDVARFSVRVVNYSMRLPEDCVA